MSRDPITEQGGLNLFGFGNNNLIGAIDAFGDAVIIPFPPGDDDILPPMHGIEPVIPPIEWFYPSPDPVGFALCQRDFDDEDVSYIGAIINETINGLGGRHQYIHYKSCSDCPTRGWGFSGGGPRPNPDDETIFRPTDCKPCKRTGAALKHGFGEGKTGKEATDQEIVDCIRNSPIKRSYNKTIRNRYICWDWAKDAIDECGLNCN